MIREEILIDIESFVGKIIKKISLTSVNTIDDYIDPTELNIIDFEGEEYLMYHQQECCESVYLADIVGDITDIIGHPILRAEKVTSSKYKNRFEDNEEILPYPQNVPQVEIRDDNSVWTWTFYKLSTIRGSVTLRWIGLSNGYYSEDVGIYHLKEVNNAPPPEVIGG